MTVKGRVIQVLPVESGVGKNGEWKKQSFILETEGQYPKPVCIGLWGDKVENPSIAVGNILEVSVNAESREYNGRWYTDLQAWKFDVITSVGSQKTSDQPAAKQAEDDLPF